VSPKNCMNNKAVFLDKDGVVCESVIYDGKPCAPRKLGEFTIMAGVPEAIRRAKALGFKVIVVTNQPDIARGDIDRTVVSEMARILIEDLSVDEVFVCEHQEKDRCDCRKPRPGMLLSASKKLNLDLKNSFMVGDTWRDVAAGRSAGCKTVLVGTDPAGARERPDLTADDLPDAIKKIEIAISSSKDQ
jgi:D-glycero-D-manno-heptose 1,7-bisphosphate phosphatase